MRVHGWCTTCHKVKRVRVSVFVPGQAVQMGLCSECENPEPATAGALTSTTHGAGCKK